VLTNNTIEPTRKALQRIVDSSHEGELENVVRCRDGSLKNSLWTVRWSNQERSYYCVVHDITELRAIENLKQQFVSMVSHDLRTPLSSIGISLALLTEGRRGPVSEPVLQMIGKAQKGMHRLTDLVNELLDLEKLESGKMHLDLACVSASDVFAAAKESLETMAAMAHVDIKGPAGEAAVRADEGRLVQAVTNLLSNAIKFSPAGSTISLTIAKENGQAKISVTDQGMGIPEDKRAMLFEKFTRTQAASNVDVKGTGLGLAITKAIVEAHDGTIGVDSQMGKGSTFWIRLPLFFEKGEVPL
jgi:signal transduction histidine kinase